MPNPMSTSEIVEAFEQLVSIVKIHSEATDNNFAWAELGDAEQAIAALQAQGAEPVGYTSKYSLIALADGHDGRLWRDEKPMFDIPLYTAPPAQAARPSRDDIIQMLLATQGQSEGVTADAILSLLNGSPAQAARVPALERARQVLSQQQNAILAVIQDCKNGDETLDGDLFRQLNLAAYEFEKHHDSIYCGAPAPAEKAEIKLQKAGVFKGANGLRRLAEADGFWEDQPYGTRLYFNGGISDYLHRDVIRAAVRILDTAPASVETADSGTGLEAAAAHLEEKSKNFALDHSYQEPDTGAWVFDGDGQDYYDLLMELAEEIRGLAPATPQEQEGRDNG